jgi:D-glycero-beta-D-manno-heptose 1-phosphate adenylyltransferase
MKQSELIISKIFKFNSDDEKPQLSRLLAYWNFRNKKIVFTNGCFDIMHLGHIDYLSKAADLGDVLIIGMNSDKSVHCIKGNDRPINNEEGRARLLAALGFTSCVVLFDEETPYELIKFIRPDVLVKGSDYAPENIVGYDIVKEKGGEIVTIDFIDGYSTSSIIEKIKKL